VNFKGQERSNDTHESTTDADARLFKKSAGDKSRLCHMGHILMENRNGLIVDVEITHASGTAEREAALAMLGRRPNRHRRATVGADKGYDCKAFITGCRKLKVTPHVAAKDKHSAVDGRIRRHEGYKTSLKVRKRIEEAFGWIKTVGGLAKTKLIGQAKLTGQALLCFATYNLVRMGSLGNGDTAMRTGRPKTELLLSQEERAQQQSFARRRSLPAALGNRARIVLSSAEGESNSSIAEGRSRLSSSLRMPSLP
jgi:hypothetical protein